ncbi:hypothetical protein PAPHI01_2721, partial [Pancytospora philotis]
NDPKHKSALARRYMEKAGIRVLQWPSYSPDLNPIENVWAYLKMQIARSGKKPQNKGELKALIADEWRNILMILYGIYMMVCRVGWKTLSRTEGR